MKRTTRTIGILLTAAMMLAMLAGCGSNNNTGGAGSGGGEASSGGSSGGSSRGNVMMTFGTGDTGGSLYPAGAALSQLWTNSVVSRAFQYAELHWFLPERAGRGQRRG